MQQLEVRAGAAWEQAHKTVLGKGTVPGPRAGCAVQRPWAIGTACLVLAYSVPFGAPPTPRLCSVMSVCGPRGGCQRAAEGAGPGAGPARAEPATPAAPSPTACVGHPLPPPPAGAAVGAGTSPHSPAQRWALGAVGSPGKCWSSQGVWAASPLSLCSQKTGASKKPHKRLVSRSALAEALLQRLPRMK